MWKILGTETIYIDAGRVAKMKMAELAGDGERAEKFREFLNRSEITFMVNGTTEYCSFMIRVPDELTPEDIQLMADAALEVAVNYMEPFVEAGGKEQRYLIIFTNDKEPELLGIHKTPGVSAGKIFNPIVESLGKPGRMNSSFR